jgi:signal transduction histidine kinase
MGSGADLEELMRFAAREATQLRESLEQILNDEDRPLEDGLREVVGHARCLTRHPIDLTLGPTDGSITGLATVDLVAAVREVLTDVQRHADATLVTVYAEEQNGEALITVKHDGVGVDPVEKHPRLGMRQSVEERLTQVGGSASFESSLGGGMLITLRVGVPRPDDPLPPAESE